MEQAAGHLVPAIYRIERAAIQLRRVRWKEINAAAPEVAGQTLPDSAFTNSDLSLDDYARPPEADASISSSVVRRVGMKVRNFFGIGKAQKR